MVPYLCTLPHLQSGSTGLVHKIEGVSPILRRRLADFGILEGASIRLKGKGPFLGPLTLECNGQLIAIRRKEAYGIEVQVS